MRKLILTRFVLDIGTKETEDLRDDYHLVVVNEDTGDAEIDLLKKAESHMRTYLERYHHNKRIVGIFPYPTIGEDSEFVDRPVILDGASYHPGNNRPPKHDSEARSIDVLIDLNGHRTDFRVGYYDFVSDEWTAYDKSAVIDLDDMKWTYLELAILDKK